MTSKCSMCLKKKNTGEKFHHTIYKKNLWQLLFGTIRLLVNIKKSTCHITMTPNQIMKMIIKMNFPSVSSYTNVWVGIHIISFQYLLFFYWNKNITVSEGKIGSMLGNYIRYNAACVCWQYVKQISKDSSTKCMTHW